MSKKNQVDTTAQDKINKEEEEKIRTRLQQINNLVHKLINEKLSESDQEALLAQIRDILSQLIDAMQRRPSYITQLSQYWGSFPLWQKIIGGIILTAPPLVLGLALHVGILLAIFSMALLIYAGGGFLLTQHVQQDTASTDNVKQGVHSLVNLFSILIVTAKTLCDTLKDQMEILMKENERFKELNEENSEYVSEFSGQTGIFADTTRYLGIDVSKLSAEANNLSDHVARAEANQAILQQILQGYSTLYAEINASHAKIQELTAAVDMRQKQVQGLTQQILSTNRRLIEASSAAQRSSQEVSTTIASKITTEMDTQTQIVERFQKDVSALRTDVKASAEQLLELWRSKSNFNSNAGQIMVALQRDGLKPEYREHAIQVANALASHGIFAPPAVQQELPQASAEDSLAPS